MTPRMNDRQVNGYYQVKSREYRKKYFLKFFKTFIPTHFFAIHLRAKRIRPELGDWKQIMIVALWKKTIIAFQILPKGTTVDYSVYLDFLQHRLLPESENKKFGRPIILHDNAKPHKHRVVREWLMAKRWEELEHPPYSPDMSPPDMDAIYRIKAPNKGKLFQTENELFDDYRKTIMDINEKHESKGIDMLPDRWRAISIARGEYVE